MREPLMAPAIPASILRPLIAAAEQRWGALSVYDACVAAYLLARRPEGASPDTFEWLATLETADLVLASACLAGDPVALATLERRTARIAEEVLARHPAACLDGAELRQRLLRQLLVSDGAASGLEQYAGRGALEGFIRVAAVRFALHEAKARERVVPLEQSTLGAASGPGGFAGELEQLGQRYRAPFEEALRDALRALAPRDRNLLRLYYLERLPCEHLASLYGVHTTTAWRWIGRTTSRLHEDVARRLVELTGASPSEVESILRVVATRLEGSLGGALDRTEE